MAQVNEMPPKLTGILVSVNKNVVDAIAPAGAEQAEAARSVGEYASWALGELADGGLLLSASDVARMEEAVGNLKSPADIVTAMESGHSRKEGKVIIPWSVDPVYLPNLEEIAETTGRSVEGLLQDVMDTAMSKGWLYEWNPEPVPLMFSEDDLAEIAEIIGVDAPTGTDIASFIRQQTGFELKDSDKE